MNMSIGAWCQLVMGLCSTGSCEEEEKGETHCNLRFGARKEKPSSRHVSTHFYCWCHVVSSNMAAEHNEGQMDELRLRG